MNKTIIITTGGTGGHIFPAQTIAKKLKDQGFKQMIFGDKNYAKYHKPEDGYPFNIISSSQLGRSPIMLIKSAIKITLGIIQSLLLMLKYQPKIVIAFGGYSTFPVLIAAVILRKKIVLHEQNAHLGKVNRMFTKFASIIALSYLETDGIGDDLQKTNPKLIFTGNPVRDEIIALSNCNYQLPDLNQKLKEPDNLGYDVLLHSEFYNQNNQPSPSFNILVLGGSGGARIFSDILPKAFFNLRNEIKNNLNITMQCRSDLVLETNAQYQSFNLNVNIKSFFNDIDQQIKKSHLIIARSGSSSLAEFSCAKKPMILIPFAAAADNHQEKNARKVEKAGGAIVIKEQDFTINNVTGTIEKLIDNQSLLYKMSDNAFTCANLDASSKLSTLIIDLANATK